MKRTSLIFLFLALNLLVLPLKAEVFDCSFGGKIHYGVPDSNDPTLRLFRQTEIVDQSFVINLSGFIPQDKKDISLEYQNGLQFSDDQDFKVKLLMIQDHGSGNILAYLSVVKPLENDEEYVFGTSRLALSILNDQFAFGIIQRPYWFFENWHKDANLFLNIHCTLQDHTDPSRRGVVQE